MDAALLFGDDPYRYPRHLPKVNATGGPGGKPSCGSLPDPSANFPVRTWSPTPVGAPLRTRSAPIRGVGNPWWANYFPTTKNPPEPPRYFYRGGAAAAMKRRKLSGIIARVALFTAVCLVFTFALITVFGQLRFDDRTGYHAVFTNMSGLKSGNFVRIAGVEVGKVGDLTLHRDGTVTVDFAVDKGVRLTEGTKAVVRYENLIGDRYLALEDGPGSPRRLPPGATIPLARTSPALDIDALIGGFRPLFRALDPDQVNALSGELLRSLPGAGRHPRLGAGADLDADLDPGRAQRADRRADHQLEHGAAHLRHARPRVLRRPGQAVPTRGRLGAAQD